MDHYLIIQYVTIDILEDKVVATLMTGNKVFIDDEFNPMCCVFLYNNLIIPNYVVIKNKNLLLDKNKFLMFYNQIIN